ncbi:MAG TPA: tRNA adenosine(34) deaminase TadA [Gammaproteobacteria bacterium]
MKLYGDEYWMEQAIALAKNAQELDEVPVGAIVVLDGEVIGRGFNQPISGDDPTAHAEIIALRDAGRQLGNYRLPGSTLYVTLEPCMMCAGAMVHSRITRLVYGAPDAKTGVIDSYLDAFSQPVVNHKIEVTGGVMAQECGSMLTTFFRNKREKNQ